MYREQYFSSSRNGIVSGKSTKQYRPGEMSHAEIYKFFIGFTCLIFHQEHFAMKNERMAQDKSCFLTDTNICQTTPHSRP